jgi:HD-GYP domain-containing protein (c-di-GMP phosphodiesterase class II)
MKEQVTVEKLAIGMFVAELDRPWLETKFLIQGFVIESQEQIEEFQRCCKHVFVERSLSSGDQFQADVVEKPVIQRKRADPHIHIHEDKKTDPDQPAESLLGTLGQIFKSAFSSTPGAEPSAKAPPAQPAPPREPLVIIHEDKPEKPKPKPSARARTVVHEKGISSEERAYLERAIDPAATVKIYTEKELSNRGGILTRLSRLFGMSAEDKQYGYRGDKQAADEPVYADQTQIEEELPMAKEAHEKVQVVVEEVIADLNKNKVLDLEKVGDAVGWMVESVVRNPDGMIWLARLKSVDAYTYDHGLNTAIYLIAFGRHLGLPEDQLHTIGTVGLMQDVGKLKLPKALLDKREKMTSPELKIFQSHVAHSIEIMRSSKEATDAMIAAVSEHHERYDGSGYPKGMIGEQISTLGAMAGLVDSYTAMISARPYSQPMSVQQALHDLYAARNQSFKSDLVEEFIQCVGVFPVGSLVELNTAEVAVVVSQNRSRRLKPRVMLVLDSNRQPFATPIMFDLIIDPPTPSGEPYRIVRGLQAGLYDYDPKQTLDVLMESK